MVALVLAGVVAVAGLVWLAVVTAGDEMTVEVDTAGGQDAIGPVDIEADDKKREIVGDGQAVAGQVIDRAEDVALSIGLAFPADAPPARLPREQILESLQDLEPKQWGEFVPGVYRRINTDEPKIALTLDACGGGYDEELVEFLRDERIGATIFVTGLWINAHREVLEQLAEDPLFEIANHGLEHLPCSVTGKEAAGIEGTASVEEAYDEIEENARRIEAVTGQRPRFYRSGTAHYDEVCTRIARKTGHRTAGFDVVGDMGAVYDSDEVYEAVTAAGSGSIILVHMNRPDGDTAAGLKRAIPELVDQGFEFVRLSDVVLQPGW